MKLTYLVLSFISQQRHALLGSLLCPGLRGQCLPPRQRVLGNANVFEATQHTHPGVPAQALEVVCVSAVAVSEYKAVAL